MSEVEFVCFRQTNGPMSGNWSLFRMYCSQTELFLLGWKSMLYQHVGKSEARVHGYLQNYVLQRKLIKNNCIQKWRIIV